MARYLIVVGSPGAEPLKGEESWLEPIEADHRLEAIEQAEVRMRDSARPWDLYELMWQSKP